MDVVLDTNAYFSLLNAQGRNFTGSNIFVELITYLRRTKSDLIITAPVLEETTKKYSDLLAQSVKDAKDALENLKRNTIEDYFEFYEPDLEHETAAFRHDLVNPAKGFKAKVFDDYGRVSLERVIHRGVHRIRPANDKGEELRDVTSWFLILEYAKLSGQKTAFITADNHFRGADGGLHSDLLNDAKEAKVEVVHYPGISKFIAENSLTSEPATAEEMAGLVDQDELARQVISRLLFGRNNVPEGTVEDVLIGPRTFVAGQKYRVAEDSFYVEAKYSATAEAVVKQTIFSQSVYTPLTAMLNTPRYTNELAALNQLNYAPLAALNEPFSALQAGSGFWGTATVRPATTPKMTSIRSTYQYPVEIRISFRIVAGKPESLELDQLDLQKGKLVADSTTQEAKQTAK